MSDVFRWPRAAVDAWRGERVRVCGAAIHVPGTRRIRLSVVAGNLRMHRLLDRCVRSGATVVDVGANIGFNALYAARLVGGRGRVIAVEPAPDNLEVLQRNVAAASASNVVVAPVAAGNAPGMRELYLRGEKSAVNSFFLKSCYAEVTAVVRVPVVRLDDLVGRADVVKIDVEGAELEVLAGMPRLLRGLGAALIAEWHPLLQQLAGHAPDELPHWLLDRGWMLQAASHATVRALVAKDIPRLTARLLRLRRPVELMAQRAVGA